MKNNDVVPIILFGINITNWPTVTRFLILCTAVFVLYIIYGIFQELIFALPGMKPFGLYITFIQFLIYSVLSISEMMLYNGSIIRKIPFWLYFQLAFYTVATMGFSNASVGYLNYPTQVIFKCCKLIPVLIGGIIIQKKRYDLLDFLAAALMSVGLIIFSLVDNKISPNFDLRGYIMISLALVADAIIGNVQEKAMKTYAASNNEVVLYSYSIGSIYIFAIILLSGDMIDSFDFFAKHPIKTYGFISIYSLVGYLGVNVVLTLVRVVGALMAVTVTTMRKAVTIILSFYFFAKPFSIEYVWAGLIVLFAIYLNVYNKNKQFFNLKILKLLRSKGLNLNEKKNLIV